MLKTKQKEEKLDLPGFASWFCCKASAELKAQLLHQARKTIYGHWPLSLLSDIAIVIIGRSKHIKWATPQLLGHL